MACFTYFIIFLCSFVLFSFLFSRFFLLMCVVHHWTNKTVHISSICVAIFMYADDIVLRSPTVNGLQALLEICENELLPLDM